MAKRRTTRKSTRTTAKPSDEALERGLDGDLIDGAGSAETTGRMMAVTLNKPTASTRRAMLSGLANACGLGSKKGTVCTSSDFGSEGIDEGQAEQAEVVMLEDLGIALLNGDPEQIAAASTGTTTEGVILEPEYINYAMVLDEPMLLEPGLGTVMDPVEPRLSEAAPDMDTIRTMVKLLSKLVDRGDSAVNSIVSEATSTCFQDSAAATWGLQATNTVHSRLTGDNLRVAVLDTGMDLGHPDYIDRNIRHAVFETSSIDDKLHDVNGHGTHCIGTACGPGMSQFGRRYGVATEAEIFAGKVLAQQPNGRASGRDFSILRGIQWALTNRCQIISMSLGAPATNTFPQSYERAARRALRQGSLMIAATGNDSKRRRGLIAPVGRPANCPSIIGVAAVDRCLGVANFSNGRRFNHLGAEVNLSGPGVKVVSSLPRHRGSIGSLSGTSMATPHVSGVAALVAQETGFRGLDLYREMRRRAWSLGNAQDFGNGLIRL